jgi:hypothetical protein
MFLRIHRDWWEEDKNHHFNDNVNGIILNRNNRGIAIDDVHMISSTMVLNLRYGIAAQDFPERRVSKGYDLSSLGFSSGLVNLVDKELATIPRTAIGSLSTLSPWESGDGTTSSISHNAVANVTWMRGNHNIRMGLDFMVFREFRARYPQDVAPDFSFSNAWARGPLDNSAAPPVGAEFIALLAGIPGGTMARTGTHAEQDVYAGLYIQDDWKVTRKLTLNLGLRAEHESPITERFNRSVAQFDSTSSNPIEAAAIANYAKAPMPELALADFKVKGGVTFAGVGGNSREYWNSQGIQWSPRIGLAYQLNSKTVFRGGYGVFYAPNGILKTNSILSGFSRGTPITASSDSGLTFIADLTNPFPTGLLPVIGAGDGLKTTLGQATNSFAANRRMAPAHRWSAGFQYEMPGGIMIESSYVGNRAYRLPISRQMSYTPAKYLSTLPYRDTATINFLSANFKSPYYGLHPNFTGQNISRGSLLSAYPHFSSVAFDDSVGYSWYHSMQNRVEKRFSKGYTIQGAYTWSKSMAADSFLNASDPTPYESVSGLDRLHRLTGSGIWELPFGKGRRFGANMPGALELFAGGWQLGGVYQYQSGAPLGFGQALYIGDSSTIVLPSDKRNADNWFNTTVFNRNSKEVLASNISTSPLRYSNIRSDSQRRVDLTAKKIFRLSEQFQLIFRADTFNARNEVVLNNPNTAPTNSSFGKITGQQPSRSWQFALTLKF